MEPLDTNKVVADGYNQIATPYHAKRLARRDVNYAYFDALSDYFPATGKLLDLGCGGGQPVTAYFSEKGFDVVGVDISPNMIEIARHALPAGRFFVADMVDCAFRSDEFDMIISTFAIIHVPQNRQRLLFEKMHTWLRTGGVAYLTLGFRDETLINNDWHGVRMVWSTFSVDQYNTLIDDAGFTLVWHEVEHLPTDGTFYNVILWKK